MRIVLVDSSEIFRMGVRAALAGCADLVIAAEATDLATACEALRAHAPELVVTDLELPDGDAAAVAVATREHAPAARVLVLAASASDASVRRAAEAGIGGYVLKSSRPRELLAAMRDTAAGRVVAPARTSASSLAAGPGELAPLGGRAAVLDRLSAREREIFDLIIWGHTNKQVAVKLGISVKTVETHRSHINGKLQVHSAGELVRLASLCGALTADRVGAGQVAATSTTRMSREQSGNIAVDRSLLPRLVAKGG